MWKTFTIKQWFLLSGLSFLLMICLLTGYAIFQRYSERILAEYHRAIEHAISLIDVQNTSQNDLHAWSREYSKVQKRRDSFEKNGQMVSDSIVCSVDADRSADRL